MKITALLLLTAAVATVAAPTAEPPAPPLVTIANSQIDYGSFLKLAIETEAVRAARRLTEADFAAAMCEPGTVLLDARSADKYRERHIAGAVSLPFTDFTADTLAKAIPNKHTRVLIYCNNNFAGDVQAFPSKAVRASLNISTYIALATYGYQNVWELGPYLDVATSKLPWSGTRIAL